MNFKNLDLSILKKLSDPKAAGDLNVFLENLPKNAGQTVLIAAGISWALAAALGLFTTMKVQELTEYRLKLQELEALKPNVPKIVDVPVSPSEVKAFAESIEEVYRGLDIKANGSTIHISSKSTSRYTEFREAIGHVQNGGDGWRVSVEKLCVGRECQQEKLGISLKINKVSVENSS